jgi:putative nucleotidyltransferase with HDIG domain
MMNRNKALALLKEYTKNPNLIKHALAVEAAMRAYAKKFGENEEKWGLVGLLHDLDYESYPDEHPLKGASILEELGYPQEVIHAIKAHADYTQIKRESLLDKALYAVDDLTGFIVAVALVRPSKLAGLTPKSVKKKMKDKAFARAVNRKNLVEGAKALGVEFDEHLDTVIKAMQSISKELEL